MNPDRELLRSLNDALAGACDQVIGNARACALAIFPDQWNAGDSAIWAGTCALLKRRGTAIRYTCGYRSYNPDDLRRRFPDGPILLCGGGNFGDVYLNEHGLRQRILQDFPDRTIVQLPQSVWFRDADHARATTAIYRDHPRFHLIVRDEQSRQLARERLGIDAALAPDTAFALADLQHQRRAPVCDILWLRRRDVESRSGQSILPAVPELSVECCDWTVPGKSDVRGWTGWWSTAYTRAVARLETARAGQRPAWLWWAELIRPHLAACRVTRGCAILSRGRVVISDRLHAHILCLLMGIPHVLLDNVYGKNRAMHTTWTSASSLTRWANSEDEAFQHARDLIRDVKGAGNDPGRRQV